MDEFCATRDGFFAVVVEVVVGVDASGVIGVSELVEFIGPSPVALY
jgi:hypothetical protein